MPIKGRKVLGIAVVLALCLSFLGAPLPAFADGTIRLNVSNPDYPDGALASEGNTVNTVLSVPTVTFGADKTMGTLRITGKDGISVPFKPGDKIMVSLPLGTCFMQTPTADTYKNYVELPAQNTDGEPAVKYVDGTSRSITVEIGNIALDGSNTVPLDFVFDKRNYSTVRVSRLLDIVEDYNENPLDNVTRLEFFRNLSDLVFYFTPGHLKTGHDAQPLTERFLDLGEVSNQDLNKIQVLVNVGVLEDYHDSLMPDDYLTKEQAAHLVGKVFPSLEPVILQNLCADETVEGTNDTVDETTTDTSDAVDAVDETVTDTNDSVVNDRDIIDESSDELTGEYNTDNSFSPDSFSPVQRFISKAEALTVLQTVLESYESYETMKRN